MSDKLSGVKKPFTKRLWVTLFDTLLVACAIMLAVLLRFDGLTGMSKGQWLRVVYCSPIMLAVYVATMLVFKLNNITWRYAGLRDMMKLVAVCVLAVALNLLVNRFLIKSLFRVLYPQYIQIMYPRLVILFSGIIAAALLCTSRYIWILMQDKFADAKHKHIRRVLILGADAEGVKLAGRLLNVGSDGVRREPVAFLDEDLEKLYRKVGGIPVEGTPADISSVVKRKRVDEVILNTHAMPLRLNWDVYVRSLRARCLPLIADAAGGLKPAKLENLLDSDTEITLTDAAMRFYRGKRALVVGAAKPVGRAVCRALAECEPMSLTLMDDDEDGLCALRRELGAEVNIKCVYLYAGEPRAYTCAFGDARPDAVIYARALERDEIINENPLALAQINIADITRALTAARDAGASAFAYLSRDFAGKPASLSEISRALAENVVMRFEGDMRVICARSEPVIESQASHVFKMREQVLGAGRVSVFNEHSVKHISARNVALSAVNILASCASGAYTVEPGDPVDEELLAKALIRSLGKEPSVEVELKSAPTSTAEGGEPGEPTPLPRVRKAELIKADPGALNALMRAQEAGDAQSTLEILESAIAGKADK